LLTPPVSGLRVIVCQYKVRKPVIPAHTVCINTHTHTHTLQQLRQKLTSALLVYIKD